MCMLRWPTLARAPLPCPAPQRTCSVARAAASRALIARNFSPRLPPPEGAGGGAAAACSCRALRRALMSLPAGGRGHGAVGARQGYGCTLSGAQSSAARRCRAGAQRKPGRTRGLCLLRLHINHSSGRTARAGGAGRRRLPRAKLVAQVELQGRTREREAGEAGGGGEALAAARAMPCCQCAPDAHPAPHLLRGGDEVVCKPVEGEAGGHVEREVACATGTAAGGAQPRGTAGARQAGVAGLRTAAGGQASNKRAARLGRLWAHRS